MKGVIVYESHYGNTKLVAEAIAAALTAAGHEAELRNVREKYPAPPRGDLLFLGSPVRFGAVSGKVKDYVQKLDPAAWQGRPAAVFTTILALPRNATEKQRASQERYDIGAGRKLVEVAQARGLCVRPDHLWVEVTGLKGPLVATGVRQAGDFARALLASLAV